jgi:hypothetical protein
MEFAETENDMTRRRLRMRALAEVMEAEQAHSQAGAVQQRSHKHRAGGFTKVARSGDPFTTGKDKWRFGVKRVSDWWELLDEPDAFQDGSYWDKTFREKFGVPRRLYEQYYQAAAAVPRFQDKVAGSAHRGPSTQPLRIKLLATLMRFVTGCKFTVIQDMAQISAGCLERFYYDYCQWRAYNYCQWRASHTEFRKSVHCPDLRKCVRVSYVRVL